MVYIHAGRLRHFQYPLGILQMGELRLPPERPWTAEFSISFTLAGNGKSRGHSLSLRTRTGNNTHLQELILLSLPPCDLIHSICLEQALDLIIFYQWQLHMLSCKTQENWLTHMCASPGSPQGSQQSSWAGRLVGWQRWFWYTFAGQT